MKRALVALSIMAWAAVAHAAPAAESGAAPAPPAEPDVVIGLLDVRVEGVSAAAAGVFTKQIEESLEMSGLQVAPRARLHDYLAGTPWNAACLVGECLGQLRTQGGVNRVLEVALVTNGPSYHYVITLLDTGTGKPVGQLARKCDVCTTEEAFAAASLAVVELVNGVGDAAADRPGLRADPAGPAAARVGRARSRARTLGLVLIGTAVAAAAGSYYLYDQDRDGPGAAAAGAAGALGLAGVTAIGVSFTF